MNHIYVPLAESQIQYLKGCGITGNLGKLLLSKQQLLARSDKPALGLSCLPLTSLQLEYVDAAHEMKTDISIEFNYHQLKEFLKVNLNIDFEIGDLATRQQKSKRIFTK